jgi:hypothetical protein
MKKLSVVALALVSAFVQSSRSHAQAPVITAGEIADSCSSQQNTNLPNGRIGVSKTQAVSNIGQCVGFLRGWIEGSDGTTYQESNGIYVRITIKRDHIKDMAIVADYLLQYLVKHPEAQEKVADDVLRKVLHERGLLSLSMVQIPPAE